jgi:hypothetical protein
VAPLAQLPATPPRLAMDGEARAETRAP